MKRKSWEISSKLWSILFSTLIGMMLIGIAYAHKAEAKQTQSHQIVKLKGKES